MSHGDFHPDVKRLLDGELRLEELPVELRAEGEAALRLLAAVDREPVGLPAPLTARVMARIRADSPHRLTRWQRLARPRVVTLRVRPLLLAPAVAAAAALVVLVGRAFVGDSAPPTAAPAARAPAPATVAVRFVLVAPEARHVAVAGTFNQWDASATPLARTGTAGLWAATLTLPAGEHQYAFVVDGVRWLPDPAAPAVDDGFGAGRRNSVLTL